MGAGLANLATYPLEVISTRLKVQRYALAQRAARSRARKKKYRSEGSSSSSTSSSSSDPSGAEEEEVHGILNVSKADARRNYKKFVQETDGGTRIVETWEYEYDEEELYDGHLDAARKIYEREGIAGFYHGVGWDTLNTVAGGVWYFMACPFLPLPFLLYLGHTGK